MQQFRLDTLAVIAAQQDIDIVQIEPFLISQRLDLGSNQLDRIIAEIQLQLLSALLNRIPASEPMGDMNIAGQPKVGGIQDFIGAGVVENRFGMNARLVRKSGIAGNIIIERHIDTHQAGDIIFHFA